FPARLNCRLFHTCLNMPAGCAIDNHLWVHGLNHDVEGYWMRRCGWHLCAFTVCLAQGGVLRCGRRNSANTVTDGAA
ncbi:hypothetical protein, partial [Novosphingobium sp. PhB165]|uniref:hypothetical protein n=1 Tax=Novosphingobium sp. PhB165 TaxID=2485105 RepID=UPI001A9FC1C0